MRLNAPLHAHLGGGSGGVSFAYVLNPDDGRVDTVVYARSSRRDDRNRYRWDGHGAAAVAGPLPIEVVGNQPELERSRALVKRLREPGGPASVIAEAGAGLPSQASEASQASQAGLPSQASLESQASQGFDGERFEERWRSLTARRGSVTTNAAIERARELVGDVRTLPPTIAWHEDTYNQLAPEDKVVRRVAVRLMTTAEDEPGTAEFVRQLVAELPSERTRVPGGVKKRRRRGNAETEPTGSVTDNQAGPSTVSQPGPSTSRAAAPSGSGGQGTTMSRRGLRRADARHLVTLALQRWTEEHTTTDVIDDRSDRVVDKLAGQLLTYDQELSIAPDVDVADYVVALHASSAPMPPASTIESLMRRRNVLVAVSGSSEAAWLMAASPRLIETFSPYPDLLRAVGDPASTTVATRLSDSAEMVAAISSSPVLLQALDADPALRIMLRRPSFIVEFGSRPDLILRMFADRHIAEHLLPDVEALSDALLSADVPTFENVLTRLDENVNLAVAILGRPDALSGADLLRLFSDSRVLDAMRRNPSQIQTVLAVPGMLDLVHADPEILSVLGSDPDLSDVLVDIPDLALRIAGSPELRTAAYGNAGLAAVLSATPHAFDHLRDEPRELRMALATATPAEVAPAPASTSTVPLMRIRQHPLVKLAYPNERDLVAKLAPDVEFTRALAAYLRAFHMPHEIRRLMEDENAELRDALIAVDFPGGDILGLALRDPYMRSQVGNPDRLKALEFLSANSEFVQAFYDNPGIVLALASNVMLGRLNLASDIPGFWSAASQDALLVSTLYKDQGLVTAFASPTAFAQLMANDGALLRLVSQFRNVTSAATSTIVEEADLAPYGVVFHRLADAARDAHADPNAVPGAQWAELLKNRTILAVLAEDAQAPLVTALGAHPKILAAALQRSAFEEALTTDPERFLPHVNDPNALLAEIEALGPVSFTSEGLRLTPASRVLFSSLSLPLDEARARISSVEDSPESIADSLDVLGEIHEASEDLPDLIAVISDDRNVGLQAVVINNSEIVTTMRRRPALLPMLIASGKAPAAVASDLEFTRALADNGNLFHAFLNDPFLVNMVATREDHRKHVSQNREMWRVLTSPTAVTLSSLIPSFMTVISASEPLAEAFNTRPGVRKLLEDGNELFECLDAIVGDTEDGPAPARVRFLNEVVRAILSGGRASLSAAVFQPEIVDTLVRHPRFARALAAQSGVILSEDEFLALVEDADLPGFLEVHSDAAALILSNRTLFVAAIHNPDVVPAVQNVDGLRELLEHNDDVAR
ncbi:hypothetical protein ACGFYV_37445, partial [Streptomyces sp. NPDC048297]|uniref:hypothetical protein n=1 Tax=Streptomyces sp. NPDC048297 TaxID=3365531 RepID=UPI00371CAA1A